MRICFISDTHMQHPDLPAADLLVHCGDMTGLGTFNQFEREVQWLEKILPRFQHGMIFVPGNHDMGLDRKLVAKEAARFDRDPYHSYRPSCLPNDPDRIEKLFTDLGVRILRDQACEVGGVKFYGSPYSLTFYDWAFMESELELAVRYQMIPDATQVLITHSPPKYILDLCRNGNVGSDSLARRVKELPNLKINAFGHIHECGGELKELWGKKFINAAVCGGYMSGGFFNRIFVIETDDWEIHEILDDRTL